MTEAWTEVERKQLFELMGRSVDVVTFRLPNGRVREKLLRRDRSAAAVLAFTPDMRVIIAKQYRPGPDEILFELPGGFIEDGEDPAVAAARELLEETGYRGQLAFAGSCWDDASSTAKRYGYVALNCVQVGEQQLDEMEFVDIELISLDEFKRVMRAGLMTDVELAYFGLDHLGLL